MPNINIDDPTNANIKKVRPGDSLVWHVMPIVQENRGIRDRLYKQAWDKYERTFRGLYTGADKTRSNERSRLVSPALAAAIDSVSATIEDAIFARDRWFDTADDVNDQNHDDITAAHAVLEEDFDLAGVPDAIAKIVLNGCLYGTGIGKINIVRREIRNLTESGVEKEMRPMVTLEAIPPWEFVIDSQARDIESAYFCAHETHVPRKKVWNRIQSGQYKKVNIIGNSSTTTANPAGQETPDGKTKANMFDGSVFVTEYFGLVPAAMVRSAGVDLDPEDIQGNGHVEVIATIANELELLRVIVNPFNKRDRPIVAYQHNYVPGKFWGRGVSEKGWNSQRALDAELRARMDALGLVTAPMLGADITRLGNNKDLRVRPGKVILTRGKPSDVLEPINLGTLDATTFNQSSEMERMVQVATGSMDSNAPLNVDRRNETASGISMIQSAGLKRMRRTMWNLERQFLNPLIRKAYDRYMQFSPTRYPADNTFRVRGTMGIVAREFEQSNLTALLSVVQPESPTYNVILQSVIELSNSPKRDEILAQLAELNKPDEEAEQRRKQLEQIQFQMAVEELKNSQAETEKVAAEIRKIEAEIKEIEMEVQFKDEEIDIQAANAATGAAKVKLGNKQDETNRLKIKSEVEKAKIQAKSKPAATKK